MCSSAHQEMQNTLGSFGSIEVFQDDDSEFYSQFSMGIKTIAVISVEPWGVVQLGSTQKIYEMKEFINHVIKLFGGIYKGCSLELSENEPCSSDGLFLDSDMQFRSSSMLSRDISSIFATSSLTENQIQVGCEMTTRLDHLDHLLSESESFFDCVATQTLNDNSDCSVLTSSWPHFPSGPRANGSFSTPSCDDFTQLIFSLPLSNSSAQNSEYVPTNSTQSSVTDAFRCKHEDWDSFGIDTLLNKQNSWDKTLIPVVHGDNLSVSEVGASNSLFAKLGLDQLLDGTISSSKSRFEDQTSPAAKRRKIDDCSSSINTMKFQSEPNFDAMKKLQNIAELNSKASRKEPAKTGTRKAKRGTKPRPKDRQMIQDRLAELRELIPNGEKMSIDHLLERTIRHLNFMSSLRKHAESLKQIDSIKSGTVEKGNSSNGGGGVTWACEVDDQTMVCPLVVQDLDTAGQMLIEIICEEQGFFLEIVDIIRGFGLNIVKGMMEVRETKIWSHFIVEAKEKKQPTRHQIFSSLIQLLQMNSRHVANMKDHFGNVVSSDAYVFNNCQSADLFPFDLADNIQLASL
ncbi:hypothetical protein CDL12_27432 [Handroanthus impetiginosus]|uniref:BHLH domain-containing protein n=1 Tax=Handroanthus impetiginosus TaxID=429701 RepID=A0A2G9G447_9LAMI|nr:hypothetical protein CDL12_27432 [Handroanthus impetiginosus]